MGDNRTESDDGREWGAVPRDSVTGEGLLLCRTIDRVSPL
jgi:Signal peptidase, peptidase S26